MIQLELETPLGKALIEENGCSIVEINNAGDDPLSPFPKGAKLENQLRVAYMDVCLSLIHNFSTN